jgi:2-methylcitrate dehydratase PrpD
MSRTPSWPPSTACPSPSPWPFSGDLADPTPYLKNDILRDQTVLKIARKVTTEFDPEQEAWFPDHFSAKVTPFTSRTAPFCPRRFRIPRAPSEARFTYDELYEKYRKLSSNVVSGRVVGEISGRILNLESIHDDARFHSRSGIVVQ